MAAIMLNPSASEFVPRSFAPFNCQPSLASISANGREAVANGPHSSNTTPRQLASDVSAFGSALLTRHVPASPGTSFELDESDMFECSSSLANAHSSGLMFAQPSDAILLAISDVTPASEEPDSTRTSFASTTSDACKPAAASHGSHPAAAGAGMHRPATATACHSLSRMAPADGAPEHPSLPQGAATPSRVVHRSTSAKTFGPIVSSAAPPTVSTSSFILSAPAPPTTPKTPSSPLDLRCVSAFAVPEAAVATGLLDTVRPVLTKSSSVPSLLHAQLAASGAPMVGTHERLTSPKEVVGEEDSAAAGSGGAGDAGGGTSSKGSSGDGSGSPAGGGSVDGDTASNGCIVAALTVPVGSIVAEVASGKPTLSRVGPQDFEVLRIVGQGAFGKVFQVTYKGDGRVYAMKVMRKDRIVQKDHSEYVRSERDVLTAVTHPYIVAMRFSFQTPSKLYLILDFVNGGHLFFNLYKQGVFSEEVARLYTAEIVCALVYLHGAGIVHRDLKPENVLLDHEGHVKITDFGLAKGNFHTESDRTNSFIGTMEYMAPEIIQSRGHGKGVDWWSTGILLYEMLCGMPPFRAKSRQALQTQIVSSKIKFPKFMGTDAQALLKGLLNRDVAKRLGSGPNGSEAIKKHPFFKGINWAKLERREVESKFKPMVANSMCTANFDKLWTDQKPVDSPCGTPTSVAALDQHAHLFQGFSYVSPAYIIESVEALQLRAAAASPGVVAALAAATSQ